MLNPSPSNFLVICYFCNMSRVVSNQSKNSWLLGWEAHPGQILVFFNLNLWQLYILNSSFVSSFKLTELLPSSLKFYPLRPALFIRVACSSCLIPIPAELIPVPHSPQRICFVGANLGPLRALYVLQFGCFQQKSVHSKRCGSGTKVKGQTEKGCSIGISILFVGSKVQRVKQLGVVMLCPLGCCVTP